MDVSNMEEKKRVSKRLLKKNSDEVKTVTVIKHQDNTSDKIESLNFDVIENMKRLPDFHAIIGKEHIVNMLGKCYFSTPSELNRRINDPTTTVGELQAIAMSIKAYDTEANIDRVRSKVYIDSRLFGKIPDVIEHTGSHGAPIEINNRATLDFSKMSKEQLLKMQEVLGFVKEMKENENIVVKEGNDNAEAE